MGARAERMERRLEIPLLVAALLTIPAIAIEQSGPGPTWGAVAAVLNWAIWLAFLTEIVLMLRVVDDRWAWLRDHPLELAIVLLTPPLLPAGLQAARVFRLLRLLRLLKAARIARRFLSTEGVRDAGVLAVATIFAGGAGFTALERDHHRPPLDTWDGIWWSVTTVTTVGYGDVSPATTGGRVIAIVVMLVGIGFVAILTAAAAERFLRARTAATADRRIEDRLDEIVERLDGLERRA